MASVSVADVYLTTASDNVFGADVYLIVAPVGSVTASG